MDELSMSFSQTFKDINYATFLFKLIYSTLCGSILAFHLVEWKEISTNPKRMNFAKAQIITCLAGTIMVIIIGDSVARAFGLFGLGSFIRFRTALKEAVDTAFLFILIAIGMAIGLGLYAHGLIITVFLYMILFILKRCKATEVVVESEACGTEISTVQEENIDI